MVAQLFHDGFAHCTQIFGSFLCPPFFCLEKMLPGHCPKGHHLFRVLEETELPGGRVCVVFTLHLQNADWHRVGLLSLSVLGTPAASRKPPAGSCFTTGLTLNTAFPSCFPATGSRGPTTSKSLCLLLWTELCPFPPNSYVEAPM